jgi:hypothetical protein
METRVLRGGRAIWRQSGIEDLRVCHEERDIGHAGIRVDGEKRRRRRRRRHDRAWHVGEVGRGRDRGWVKTLDAGGRRYAVEFQNSQSFRSSCESGHPAHAQRFHK